jgi:GDP-L-fucose synthase
MQFNSRIFVAGHRGLVGSAIKTSLAKQGFHNVVLRTHQELDLTDNDAVVRFFENERPQYVFLAAAKVGGILANNTFPAEFIHENLEIQTNVIDAAYHANVDRLIFLGSSCIYPKACPQPIKEQYLLTGPLEPTNRSYAIAKIAGIELCWSYNRQYGTKYIAVMPTNLYGPGDNYDLNTSHVLPALIRKVVQAKAKGEAKLVVWGTGTPYREFLFNSDMADACVFLINLDDARYHSLLSDDEPPLINIGSGNDLTIKDLAELVCRVLQFDVEIVYDAAKPDGTPRKLMDSSRINQLGWKPEISLETGIKLAYESALAAGKFAH